MISITKKNGFWKVRILENFYGSVYRTDERRDQPSLSEASTLMDAPRFAPPAPHKELSTLGTGPPPLHVTDSS